MKSTFNRHLDRKVLVWYDANIQQRDQELEQIKQQLQEALESHEKQIRDKEEAYQTLKAKSEQQYNALN